MPSWAQFLKNSDKRLDHDEIDEFLDHLNASLNRRIKRFEEEERNLSTDQFEDPRDIDGYRDHLADLAASSHAAKALGDELSILALYKKVEAHIGRVIKRRLPTTAKMNLSYFKNLCSALPFDIKAINGYSGFNELRLLNNSIKHGGKVSSELAKEFPMWKEDDELSGLGDAFQRLLPEVKRYVADFAEKLYTVTP